MGRARTNVDEVDEVDNEFLEAIVRVGLRCGTPAGLASAVRAAVVEGAAVLAPPAGGVAAVCEHPAGVAAGVVGREEPDAVFDWIYR